MLICLSFARLRAQIKAMSSTCGEDVPGGRGLASMTWVEDTIAHPALHWPLFMSELPSMNWVSSGEEKGNPETCGKEEMMVARNSEQECSSPVVSGRGRSTAGFVVVHLAPSTWDAWSKVRKNCYSLQGCRNFFAWLAIKSATVGRWLGE